MGSADSFDVVDCEYPANYWTTFALGKEASNDRDAFEKLSPARSVFQDVDASGPLTTSPSSWADRRRREFSSCTTNSRSADGHCVASGSVGERFRAGSNSRSRQTSRAPT